MYINFYICAFVIISEIYNRTYKISHKVVLGIDFKYTSCAHLINFINAKISLKFRHSFVNE